MLQKRCSAQWTARPSPSRRRRSKPEQSRPCSSTTANPPKSRGSLPRSAPAPPLTLTHGVVAQADPQAHSPAHHAQLHAPRQLAADGRGPRRHERAGPPVHDPLRIRLPGRPASPKLHPTPKQPPFRRPARCAPFRRLRGQSTKSAGPTLPPHNQTTHLRARPPAPEPARQRERVSVGGGGFLV